MIKNTSPSGKPWRLKMCLRYCGDDKCNCQAHPLQIGKHMLRDGVITDIPKPLNPDLIKTLKS